MKEGKESVTTEKVEMEIVGLCTVCVGGGVREKRRKQLEIQQRIRSIHTTRHRDQASSSIVKFS